MKALEKLIAKWNEEKRLGKKWFTAKVLEFQIDSEQVTLSTPDGILTFNRKQLRKKTELVGIYTKSTFGRTTFRLGKMIYHYVDHKDYRLVVFGLNLYQSDS